MAATDLQGAIIFLPVSRANMWPAEVKRKLREFAGHTKAISGSLTVTGHSYWIILEYGSSPRVQDPGPGFGDAIVLNPPINAPQASKGHISPYPIAARRKKSLRFIASDGSVQFRKVVYHPGIAGRGFIRRAIQNASDRMVEILEELEPDDIPDRQALVDLVNVSLIAVLQEVRANTPIGSADKYANVEPALSDDAGHLRDAWGIEPAE
jgi:hypothetical protein